MVAKTPQRFAPSIVLSRLGKKVPVALLPAVKEREYLVGDIAIPGRVIHPHKVRRVAKVEAVVLKLVYGLHRLTVNRIQRHEAIHKACVEGVSHLAFREVYGHSSPYDLLPGGSGFSV